MAHFPAIQLEKKNRFAFKLYLGNESTGCPLVLNQGKACCWQLLILLTWFKSGLEFLKPAFQSLYDFRSCGADVSLHGEDLVLLVSETPGFLFPFLSLFCDVLTVCVLSRAKESMYHALGYSTIVVLQAIMTFEQQDIQNGISAMKDALQTCQKYDWVVNIWVKTPDLLSLVPRGCRLLNQGLWVWDWPELCHGASASIPLHRTELAKKLWGCVIWLPF